MMRNRESLRARIALDLASGGAFVATALCVTWPLALHLRSHVPLGQLTSATVPWFNLWVLEWNADRLAHGFVAYWDAPIFYPLRGALAYSEPEALTAMLFSALQPLFGAVAAYNATLLAWLTLNGVAAQRLMRIAGVSRLAAAATGVLAVALPFALKELGVLQLLALFPLLFALAELCVLFRAPAWPAVVRLGVWLAVAAWTCVYYALFLSLLFALALAWLARKDVLRARLIGAAALSLAIAVLAAAPLVGAQRAAIAHYERSRSALHHGSAYAQNYAMLPPQAFGAHIEPWFGGTSDERNLYPGSLLLLLAAGGVAREWRGPRRRFVVFCAVSALLAVLCSFGTRLGLFGMHPYALLQAYWPGFAQLRSPYRFAGFAHVLLLVLAGFGLERLLRASLHVRGRSIAAACAVFAVVLALLEVVPFGAKLERFPAPELQAPWIAWLHAHPGGAVAMAPPEHDGTARAFEPIVLAMLQGLRHGHPLANGYSGFFPASATLLARQLRTFPDRACLTALAEHGVRYVVAERAWVEARIARDTWSGVALRAVHTDRAKVIYELDSYVGSSIDAR